VPSKIASPPLSEFPLVIEELEIAPKIALQRRLSSCESRGALTVTLRESTVWFGFLDPPHLQLAECFGEVASELRALELRLTAAKEDLAEVGTTHQAIVADAELEYRSLTAIRIAMKGLHCKEVVAHANFVIERSRSTVSRHRELTEAAEDQVSMCEQRIVLSRLKFLLGRQNTNRLCRHTFDPSVEDLQLILDKRALIKEEKKIIHETEVEIARSGESLDATRKFRDHVN
jgi:hypothetical protein